jgi:hypothetical protein
MARVPFPLSGGVFSTKGMEFPIGVYEEVEKAGRIIQTPASQYFLLNSADRLQNASLGQFSQLSAQPWNDFRLQKPAVLMSAFAKRIDICEVRFPWAIPNITARNNTFYILNLASNTEYQITVTPGFYTPSELVTTINLALDTTIGAGDVVCSYDSANQTYTFNSAVFGFEIGYVPSGAPENAVEYYITKPSLLKTMGFALNQLGAIYQTGDDMTGQTTNTLYTEFVDIVSNKLMMNTKVQDGTSANESSKTSVMCRLFLADESSVTTTAPIGCRPFVIHRQFVTPKHTKWNPEQFIDWLDIAVYDQYGQLVPLPTFTLPVGSETFEAAYPDFQITCLASEA